MDESYIVIIVSIIILIITIIFTIIMLTCGRWNV